MAAKHIEGVQGLTVKLYQTETQFNCCLDLHSRCMYVCVVDYTGKIFMHHKVRDSDFEEATWKRQRGLTSVNSMCR